MAEPRVPSVRASRYDVSLLPESDVDHHSYLIQVEVRSENLWAVTHHGFCMDGDGVWSYEPRSSNREDDWLERNRFTLSHALRLAREEAPRLSVNGATALELWQRKYGDKGEQPSPVPAAPEPFTYHCREKFCSAVARVISAGSAQESSDTYFLRCDLGHSSEVTSNDDLKPITNQYWPAVEAS